MNAKQRSHYFGTLWPAACKSQGWKTSDEHRRKYVTFAATGEESTTDLDQDQITLLFNKLKWLADPTNADKAFTDADPVQALAENQRKKLIWRIEKAAARIPGDAEAMLAKMAENKCAFHRVLEWRKLPTTELLRFAYTVSSRTTAEARAKRATKASKTRAARPVQATCKKAVDAPKKPHVFTAHPNGTIYIGEY